MKKYYVEFEFPELPSPKTRHGWHGEASGMGMAVHQALKDVKKRPAVARRRLHQAVVKIQEIIEDKSTPSSE